MVSAKKVPIYKRRSRARLILLCGLPASGKTTLARKLADELGAIRFCPDEWLIELGIDPFDNPARDRLEEQLWKLAQELLRLGQSVILEYGFWGRAERDEKRLRARALDVAVELRYLALPIDELWQRLDARNKRGLSGAMTITRQELKHWATKLQLPDAAELKLFDNFEAV